MLKPRICGCIFIFSLSWSAFLTAVQVTDPSEVNVLRAVKSSLNDHKDHLYNWNRGDPCKSNWTGVFCFDSPGKDGYFHLQELQLLNMNLSGNLAPELGKLTQLEILDFMWNELTGNIPKEIGNITSLKLLLLNGNKLSGSLPEELGYFPQLRRLQVDENQISGPIPKSFANLTSLLHLHLNNNSISGEIPSELSTASKLIHLLLDNNNLSGNLPSEFSQLPELRILQLDNNNFNGSEIPSSYGNFSTLIKLSLRNCNLVGPLPDFSRINYLSYLDVSVNHLTGPIPPYKLSDNITTIDLSTNHFNESIPDSFSGLPALQTLSLANNKLTGSILASIWKNKTFSAKAKLLIDLQDNLLSEVEGELNPPVNVTLRLGGNPVCSSANIGRFCKIKNQEDVQPQNPSNLNCQAAACPTDSYFDYVPEASICFCAAPIRIGYRLKSPSISYFPPYADQFVTYITSSLGLELYQLSIDSVSWEGPRLRMHLKIYPVLNNGSSQSHLLNTTEVERIRHQFASWHFPQNDLFGPYELLNFTLLGPYSTILPQSQKAGVNKGILVAIALGAVVGALFVCAVITFVIARRTRHWHSISRRDLSASRISMKIEGVKAFGFREMALATDNFNFSSQVGQGGYGRVYKGILSDGSVVAIKRAEEGSLQGQKEFLTEIELLSRLHHRNLVSLVGFCDEEGEQMLVYEFMPNGTLRQWLSGKGKEYLEFSMRVRIGLGSAKGILYLHTEANPPVFHRDIKATNILLDSRLTAKVADFGLSRLAPVLDDEGCVPDHVSTVVKGTPGYLDPEYFLTHKLTDKSDVYSFGVVLLELLTGLPPISHGKNIVREVNTAQESGMMFTIIDTKMGSYPSECMHKFAGLALTCCHDQPDYRPSMLDVVRELESILKMMPQTTDISLFSDTASTLSTTDSLATSSSYVSSQQHHVSIASTTLTGSESSSALISGVVPSITPR